MPVKILTCAVWLCCSVLPVWAAEPDAKSEDFPGKVRLAVPPVIYAVPGLEANVYFDNISLLLNPANYTFDVHTPKGIHQAERWTFVPKPADVGDHPWVVEVRDEQNELVARGRSVIRVIPSDRGAGQPRTLLCVGDSLTHASVYPQRLLSLCEQPGNPTLKLVGSHAPNAVLEKVRHEGYGGWTAHRFATHASGTPRAGDYAQRASPFLYPDGASRPTLDFQAYCKDVNGGAFPDFVTIFLGPNDIFSLTDATLEAGLTTILSYYDLLVEMIIKASPHTRVGIMLPVPPAASQDAFGANYATGQTRWQYRRNQHRLVERMLTQYGGRVADRIDLIPTHANLDCQHNYPVAEGPWNSATSLSATRQNNGVHPASTGYHQIGDSVYTWMKALSDTR
ncbi:MAG: hypothetical protein JSS02_34345 [Planctomycetes bacterium]|nr:hypothetical protein [Planctomycetota bacterium]